MLRVLRLSGDPRTIGQQHGEQVSDLRPTILAAIQVRLAEVLQEGVRLSPQLDEIGRLWQEHAPATLEMLLGMAEALDLDWETYFAYTVASYLADRRQHSRPSDGCTTWAAAGDVTWDGAPLLAKNRDQRPDHLPLQCLARVQPERGYPYLCLTSAGSPGVFSSGINAAGLAVADTYVPSSDIGPGIGRYSLMMDLLEAVASVQGAIGYLHTRPHFGDGTVSLADAAGDLAVFEIAHSAQAVLQSDEGYLISTNHFTAPETCTRGVDHEPPHLRGNSLERRRQVEQALRSARGKVDVSWSQNLMAQHGTGLSSICRHPELDPNTVTISTVIFSPQTTTMHVASGQPCQAPFELFQVLD